MTRPALESRRESVRSGADRGEDIAAPGSCEVLGSAIEANHDPSKWSGVEVDSPAHDRPRRWRRRGADAEGAEGVVLGVGGPVGGWLEAAGSHKVGARRS